MVERNLKAVVEAYDALFLDNDGTCAKTEELHAQVGTKILQEAGVVITYEERYSFMGFGERAIWDHLNAQGRTPSISKEEFLKLQAERFLDAVNKMEDPAELARPGIKSLVDAFRAASKPVIVVSNTPREVVNAIQKAIGLYDLVDRIISLDDMLDNGLQAKPSPDGYNWAKEIVRTESGVKTGRYLALEDAEKGWKAAYAANCDTLLIHYKGVNQKPNPEATYNVADDLDVCDAFTSAHDNVVTDVPQEQAPAVAAKILPSSNIQPK